MIILSGYGSETTFYITGSRALKVGSQGTDAAELQDILKQKGFYFGQVSGYYDYATSEAVKAFQKAKRMAVDGVTGAQTWTALGVKPYAIAKPMQKPAVVPMKVVAEVGPPRPGIFGSMESYMVIGLVSAAALAVIVFYLKNRKSE